MKVLFVNNFRGRGGGEEFLRDLLPGLAKQGVQVGLVCRPGTPLEDMFRNSAVEVFPVDRSGIKGITAVFRIAGIIRSRGYGLVNIQRGHDIIQSWLGAFFSGRRPVLMYTPQVPEFIRSRFLLRRMNAIVTISRYIRDVLAAFDPVLAGRITIVQYGIDLDKFRPGTVQPGFLRKRFGLDPPVPIIGTVGDLWKNQIEFLDVLALLRKTIPDVRYAIVGDPKENELFRAFRSRAAELGLQDAVLWPGRLEKDEMLSFYADIDLAVSTYRNEGFGIWILEAMAMGKPVVSYNAGGIRDSLEGSPAGVLVDGGPGEMAAVITGILGDAGTRATMAEGAPQWVRERFRRQRMIGDYERFFTSLVQKRHGEDSNSSTWSSKE
jgi:glycosyltransferase involved in cell wall biosynthesis